MTTAETSRAHIASRSPRRSVWYAGRLLTVLVTSAETDGRFSIVEELARKSSSLDLPHLIQTREMVCSYVIEGELAVEVGGKAMRVVAGACITIPQGVPHRVAVTSDSLRLVTVYAPGGFEGFFLELGAPAVSPTPPGAPVVPLDVERLVCVAAKYAVEVVATAP